MDFEKKRKCCIPICGGEKFDLVHKLPMAAEQAAHWRDILTRVLPEIQTHANEEIRKKYFVCYRHFTNADYKNIESRNLNKTAFPSVNLMDLSESHACPRLRFNTKPTVANFHHIPSESKTSSIDYQKFETTPKELIKRKIDTSVDNKLLIPSKRVKIVYQRNIIQPPKQQDSSADSHSRSLNPKITEKSQVILNSLENDEHQCLNESPMDLDSPNPQGLETAPEAVTGKKEAIVLENILPNSEADSVEVQNSPKKLVALFEVTPKQLLELQEQFRNNTVQLLNADPEKDAKDTMAACDYIELVSEKYTSPIKINHLWLRDHCRCEKCYNSETFQRKINLLSIPLDIAPEKYDFDDERLNVLWHDGHESVYSMDFLYTNQYEVQKSQVEKLDRVLWDKAIIETADYARVKLSDLICKEEPIQIVMKSLIKYGFAFIENVPANTQSTEMAIKRLFPIKKTLFGEMWTFSDNKDHSDTAYTKDFLPAHTDNTYFNDAAGLQVLHCIQHTGTGGLSLLQDGFKALLDFKANHPDSYQRLCDISIPSEYIEGDGQHHKYTAPIIRLDPLTQQPEQIRFNTLDRAPLNTIPLDCISQFYADYQMLAQQIQNAENEWWFKLEPGTVVIFDNWRVMHGRSEYQGKRIMTGCYVERTDFMSLARVLKLVS